jgi:hypothetical protein
MVTKNKQQLTFLYGEDTVNTLENCIKDAIKNGNCVTVDIDSIDEFEEKHLFILKMKLFFKRLFRR